MATSSPMVSARQVVAMPIRLGAYCRTTFSRPVRRFSRPPKMAVSSLKFEEAMSSGSRKWLIM